MMQLHCQSPVIGAVLMVGISAERFDERARVEERQGRVGE